MTSETPKKPVKPMTDEEFVEHLKRLGGVETEVEVEDEDAAEDEFWLEVLGGDAKKDEPPKAPKS